MDFINADSFSSHAAEYQEMRRKRHTENLKFMLYVFALCSFTGSTLVLDSFMNRNLFHFPMDPFVPIDFSAHPAAYWLLWPCLTFVFLSTGILCVNTTMLLCTFLKFVSYEFEILGISLERAMDDVNDDTQAGMKAAHDKLVEFTKRHQELLK